MFLQNRNRLPELMDAAGLDEGSHRHALNGLKRLNTISRSATILWPALHQASMLTAGRPLRVLDLACGGGDVSCDLASRALRHGLKMELHGCDRSCVALKAGQELAVSRGLQNMHFFELDVLRDPIPTDYDIVMCSLFLHHLDTPDVVDLLRRMSISARYAVLANDLRRTLAGYALAWVGCHFFSRSPIVHVDGPRSVRGAFSCDEIRDLAKQAELTDVVVTRHWPQRFLLRWTRK